MPNLTIFRHYHDIVFKWVIDTQIHLTDDVKMTSKHHEIKHLLPTRLKRNPFIYVPDCNSVIHTTVTKFSQKIFTCQENVMKGKGRIE